MLKVKSGDLEFFDHLHRRTLNLLACAFGARVVFAMAFLGGARKTNPWRACAFGALSVFASFVNGGRSYFYIRGKLSVFSTKYMEKSTIFFARTSGARDVFPVALLEKRAKNELFPSQCVWCTCNFRIVLRMEVTHRPNPGQIKCFSRYTWNNPQIFVGHAFGAHDICSMVFFWKHERTTIREPVSIFSCFCETLERSDRQYGDNLVFS